MASQQNMVSGVPPLSWQGNLADNFKTFKQRVCIFLLANGLDEAKELRKVNILLNFIGEKGIKIYNSFNLDETEVTLKDLIAKFEAYFEPRKSLTIARNDFFTITQNGTCLEEFFEKVINLGIRCEFGELREGLSVSKIISGLDSSHNNLRARLMAEDESKLTLDYVMKYILGAESSRKYIEGKQTSEESSVLLVQKKQIRNCRNCGMSHNIKRLTHNNVKLC